MNEINSITGQNKKSRIPAMTKSATNPRKMTPKITRLMKKIIASGMPTNKNRNIARPISMAPVNKAKPNRMAPINKAPAISMAIVNIPKRSKRIAPKRRNGASTNRVTTSGIKFQAS